MKNAWSNAVLIELPIIFTNCTHENVIMLTDLIIVMHQQILVFEYGYYVQKNKEH